jgi:hypothetical protein
LNRTLAGKVWRGVGAIFDYHLSPKRFVSIILAVIFMILIGVYGVSAQDAGIYNDGETGAFDRENGRYIAERETSGGEKITAEIGVTSEFSASGAYYIENNKLNGAFEEWLGVYVRGYLGAALSYGFELGVAPLYVNYPFLGYYQTNVDDDANKVPVYGMPPAYFPYAYKGRWDGFVFNTNNLQASGPSGLPEDIAFGFSMLCEISGSAVQDIVHFSAGRKEREFAAMIDGGSLVLNKFAQPFWGIDFTIQPFSWLGLSSVTGILEYFDMSGIQISSKTFQNAFSLTMIEMNHKNYVRFNIGTSSVWPKRFEPAYLFPLIDKMLYQNNIGDFDNIGLFGGIKLQKPGLGYFWTAFFIDEINFEPDFFILDREMYAYQTGVSIALPRLLFGSLNISYTKIEPYCYTHTRLDNTPWYNGIPMEEAYMNHGSGLGYYLPPNSDEIKLKFQYMPFIDTMFHAQFQMIRHGAVTGESAVDGSSHWSELGKNRSENPALRKFFLHDGAYNWSYILKSGAVYKLKNYPVTFSLESGFVISYWTNINGPANNGAAHDYHIIDSNEYPKSTGLITAMSIRVFK